MNNRTEATKAAVTTLKQDAGLIPFLRLLPDLAKKGKEYRARCCWHSPDKNPSLSVFQKNGTGEWFYKCFSCHKSGDVIKLVRELDGISFSEAKKRIADEGAGQLRPEAPGEDKTPAQKFPYNRVEAQAAIDKAQDYLVSRGIPLALAKQRGLGYVDYPTIGAAVTLPYSDDVIKVRALNPKDKEHKFRHFKGGSSCDLLFGIDELDCISSEVIVVESELDALTMVAHGFNAVSVSSATTCLDEGKLKIRSEHMEKLRSAADRIFIAVDMDAAGEKCAAAFEAKLPQHQCFRVKWPFEKGVSPKDIGELFVQCGRDAESFRENIEQLKKEALDRPPAWRTKFKSHSEMEQGEMKFLIKNFLPEGVAMIGALSSSGKTWFALSLAKALTTVEKLLGHFEVTEPVNVLYMIPESGELAFRNRLEKMGLQNDRFLCRTMKDGLPLKLDDPDLLAAVRELRPVVFLDTAVRFTDAESENSANENAQGLALGIFALCAAGARAVIGVHHSTKASRKQDLVLENTLRGTGDLGAMSDVVFGLKVLNEEKLQVEVKIVKARDFEPVKPFVIQGRPFINVHGDFKVVTSPGQPIEQAEQEKLVEAIKANPTANYRTLATATGITLSRVAKAAEKAGWKKQGNQWVRVRKSKKAPSSDASPAVIPMFQKAAQ